MKTKLNHAHAMKAYGGSVGTASLILNLGTRWDERSASGFGRFTPR